MNKVKIAEQVKDWYSVGMRQLVPSMDSKNFFEFAADAVTFIQDTMRLTFGPGRMVDAHFAPISLSVDNGTDSGYAKIASREIYISGSYFNQDSLMNLGFEDADAQFGAMALINGTVIHEALHVAFTEPVDSIRDYVVRKAGTKAHDSLCKEFGKGAFYAMINILEDLFIEANCPSKLRGWLFLASQIFFGEKDFEGLNPMSRRDAVNLAVLYKNPELRSHPIFLAMPEAAMEVLEEAASGKPIDNVQLATVFLRAFTDEEGNGDSSEGEGEDGEESKDDKGAGGKGAPEASSNDETADGEKMTAPMTEAVREALESLSDEEAKELAKAVAAAMEKMEKNSSPVIEREVEVFDTKSIPSSARSYSTEFTLDKNADWSFINELIAIRTENRVPGQARRQGPTIVKQRLTRIVTDEKIFSKRDSVRRDNKRIEIVILCDMSGSTMGTLINREMSAAYGMAKALTRAGVANSVWGHTGGSTSSAPGLMHIYSYDMVLDSPSLDDAFLGAAMLRLSENYDGMVIEKLDQIAWTNREASRFMIVLSDGAPLGASYNGAKAQSHTKKIVEAVRARGRKVFSISLVESVVRGNNMIYGESMNVNGSKNLKSEFSKLVRELVQ